MNDYHDATLKNLIFDWETGATTMTLVLCVQEARETTITMRDTTDIKCERRFPWGQSVFVNRLDMQRAESGHRLEFELQSGDKIVLLGGEVVEDSAD